ncbi:MAG: hypothetical protein AB1646_20665 [Thermodesulfobacteriota bacterium]
MPLPNDPNDSRESPVGATVRSGRKQLSDEAVLRDLRGGTLRTKGIVAKYGMTVKDFEQIIIRLIRSGQWTKEEFRDWKAHRSVRPNADQKSFEVTFEARDVEAELGGSFDEPSPKAPAAAAPQPISNPETYIIHEREVNDSLAMKLFTTKREEIGGARFKVLLQGKKLAFTVDRMLFRGPVELLHGVIPKKTDIRKKREEALDYVAKHGWAAYLESRAFTATFGGSDAPEVRTKARLVLVQARNNTYVAAIHTPLPSINVYVDSNLDAIRDRLAKVVDIRGVNF